LRAGGTAPTADPARARPHPCAHLLPVCCAVNDNHVIPTAGTQRAPELSRTSRGSSSLKLRLQHPRTATLQLPWLQNRNATTLTNCRLQPPCTKQEPNASSALLRDQTNTHRRFLTHSGLSRLEAAKGKQTSESGHCWPQELHRHGAPHRSLAIRLLTQLAGEDRFARCRTRSLAHRHYYVEPGTLKTSVYLEIAAKLACTRSDSKDANPWSV
jgi:hypothetical protein